MRQTFDAARNLAKLHDALYTMAGQRVAQAFHARSGKDADGLGCDIRAAHGLSQAFHLHDIDGLGDGIEIDRLIRTDDQPAACIVAPDPVDWIERPQHIDFLPDSVAERLARRRRTDGPCPKPR